MRDIVFFLVFGAFVWAAAVVDFVSFYVYDRSPELPTRRSVTTGSGATTIEDAASVSNGRVMVIRRISVTPFFWNKSSPHLISACVALLQEIQHGIRRRQAWS